MIQSKPTVQRCSASFVSDVGNGSVTCDDGNTWGSTCEYRCDQTHELVGASTVTCSTPPDWSHEKPTCEGICIKRVFLLYLKIRVVKYGFIVC